eukprot:g641.t1
MAGMSLAQASAEKNFTFSAEQIWRIERGNQALHGRLSNIYKDSTNAVRQIVQKNVSRHNAARKSRLEWCQAIRNQRAFLINRDNELLSSRIQKGESELSQKKMRAHVKRHERYIAERARLHRASFRLQPLEREPTTEYIRDPTPNSPHMMANIYKLETSRRLLGGRLKPLPLATRRSGVNDVTRRLVHGVATCARPMYFSSPTHRTQSRNSAAAFSARRRRNNPAFQQYSQHEGERFFIDNENTDDFEVKSTFDMKNENDEANVSQDIFSADNQQSRMEEEEEEENSNSDWGSD